MLDQSHRFHGLSSLSYVHRNGKVVRGGQMSLKYSLNTRRKAHRVAIVVSRKVDKSAVVRNRIRRRIYEIVGTQSELIQEPYDIVFTVFNAQVADIDSAQLQKQVHNLLQRAGVIGRPKQASHAIVNPKE